MSGVFRVDGDAYDDFMGRYSTRLAPLFADFAGVGSGVRVLDVGAGTGALTAELLARGASVAAADPSPEFVAVLRERFPDIEVQEAPAESLPFGADEFDWRSRSSWSPSCPTLRPPSPRWRGLLAASRSACGASPRSTCSRAIDRNGGGDRRDARGGAAPLPDAAGDRGAARAARRGRVRGARRDRGLPGLRGVLAGDGSRRRPRRPVGRLARRRARERAYEELSRQLGSPRGRSS